MSNFKLGISFGMHGTFSPINEAFEAIDNIAEYIKSSEFHSSK